MKNKPKEPPKLAIKFANAVFVLGILYSILLIVYAIYKIYNLPEPISLVYYIISISCGVVFATLFGFGLKRLSNHLKVNLSVLFFSVGIAVYGFETYLEFFKKTQREIIAKQMGVPYDKRTPMEVLEDLRDSGVEALPNIQPEIFIGSNGLTATKGRIYPFGGISNSTRIFNNESGYYPVIVTDEHGFNNPKGLYKKNKVDIVLTGDSFTEGYSVHSYETIGVVLRQLDFNAISLGKGGNGPLIELATLKEYAEPLKPKIVLWLYYINDFKNLEEEMKSSILKKYLNEDDYSQNLISRQEEIDGVLINYGQSKWKAEKREKKRLLNRSVIKITKLYNLRMLFNLTPASTPTPTPTPTPTSTKSIFRDILQQSKQMVLGWGGKMYFIYIHDFGRYAIGNEHLNHDFVMQTVTELDIPIIDIHREIFDPHPDPLSLFPFRTWGHYNAEGYRLVAEAVGKRLEADGYVPIK